MDLESQVTWFSGQKVQQVPLDQILVLNGLHPEISAKVLEDLPKNGLRYPVLLVQAPRRYILWWFTKNDHHVPDLFWQDIFAEEDLDHTVLVSCGGGNRVWAARDLGYSTISAVVFSSFPEALLHQASQREQYQDWYQDRPGGWKGHHED